MAKKNKFKEEDPYKHEIDRINQFKGKARDDDHFRQLIFNRASKCSEDKRKRFMDALRYMKRNDLASFVEMTFKLRDQT